jgi:hypothetical protein
MKRIAKVVCSAVVSAALAATMAISAAAAVTYKDVVNKAKECGFQDHNVTQLENFLEKNDKFTDKQYDAMCQKLHDCFDEVISNYNGNPASLSNEERAAMFKSMTEEDRQKIIAACIDAGKDFGVKVTVTKRGDNNGYDVTAEYTDAKGDSKKDTADDKNAKTGDVNNVNAVAAVMSAIAIALAGTGIVVVAKKNREN